MIGWLARRAQIRRARRELLILWAVDALDGKASGFTLWSLTDLPVSAIYVALADHERAGYVLADWESPNPIPGRPRRRFYRITDAGRRRAGHLTQQLSTVHLKASAR